MQGKFNRVKKITAVERVIQFIRSYAYVETFIIVGTYLIIGYLTDPTDICILHTKISYIIILLTIITLFHGFENGVLALSILAFSMWYFYPSFEYTKFLIALMMTMIYSEFHYYWTEKIKVAEVETNYRGVKLDELSKAFYSLKISHDQLEKNYVVKPMSIRNSIEFILEKNEDIKNDDTIVDKYEAYYKNFLELLEKSFSVSCATIVYQKEQGNQDFLVEEEACAVYSEEATELDVSDIFQDYLVDKSLARATPIYVSDDAGEPSLRVDKGSQYIAVIPSVRANKVYEFIAIEKMPFMAFNRENLTSISILTEYVSIEINKKMTLEIDNDLELIQDENFRFEYLRLKHLYQKYKVNSVILVLRIDNELQTARIYNKIVKMLRSLDLVTMLQENEFYYITLLFPLQDKAVALGYLNRLISTLEEEKDKKFQDMTFNLSEIALLNKYYREDYAN